MAKNKKKSGKGGSVKTWTKVSNGLDGLKDAVKSTESGNNDAPIIAAAKADSAQKEITETVETIDGDGKVTQEVVKDAGAAAQAEVVIAAAKEDNGFTGPLGSNPKPLPGNPGKSKGRPAANKATAKASAKALNIADPEVKHETAKNLAEAVKTKAEAKADEYVGDEKEEDDELKTEVRETLIDALEKDIEVVTPENPDAQSDTNGSDITTDNGDNNPDDTTTPAAMGAGEEVVNEDAVANEAPVDNALIAEDGVTVIAAAKEDTGTQELQEEPVDTGTTENGGDVVTEIAEPDSDNAITDGEVITEETLVSDLVGLDANDAITESASDEPATVISDAPVGNEPEVVNEAPEVSTSSEDAATEEIQLGFSSDQLRKLENAWLKKNSSVYKTKPREEIKQLIIDEYATKPTDSIRGGEVIARCKQLTAEIYDAAHPKNAEKAAAKAMRKTTNAAAKADAPVISEDTPLSAGVPVTTDAPVPSDATEITPEPIVEAAAKSMDQEEVRVDPSNVEADANETTEAISPSSEEETIPVTTIEGVDTSEPVLAAAKGTGETEVPTAPEVPNEVAEVKAEGVATDEPVVTSEEVPFDVDVIAAAKVDTAGIAIQDEVAATQGDNKQDEVVTADQVSNDAPVVTPESEVKAEAITEESSGITDETVITDVASNQAEAERGITEANVTKLEAGNQSVGEVIEPETEVKQEAANESPVVEEPGKPKKGAQMLSHTGSIDDAMQLAGTLVKSAYSNVGNTKKYSEKNGREFLKAWMKANKFDFTVEPVDYFEAAKSFVAVNNYNILEVDEDFNILDLIKELRKYRAMDWPIFSSLIAALDNAEVHITSDRQFIFLPEPKTREVDELRAKLSQVTIALAKSEDEVKELTEVSENLVKRADHWEGIALALAEDEVIEADVITDPKVLSFHQRLKMEHRKLQPQESSSPRELSFLKKLVAKVTKLIRWQFSQAQVTRTLRKLAMAEEIAWKLEITEEQRLASQTLKMEQELFLHKQLFLHRPAMSILRVVKVFSGQYDELVVKDWSHDKDEFVVMDHGCYEDRKTIVRALTLEDRHRLDLWQETEQKSDGLSPIDRFAFQCVTHKAKDVKAYRWITNLEPGITPLAIDRQKPVISSAPVSYDARYSKRKPIEKSQPANQPAEGEKQHVSLAPFSKFSLQPSILERLLLFGDESKHDGGNEYHVLLVSNEGIDDGPFSDVIGRYIGEINQALGISIDPVLYLLSIGELAKGIGTEKFHCLDLFYQIELPYSLAINLATDLTNLAKTPAVVLQYPNNGGRNIGIAVDLPESVASNFLPKFVRDYKGSDRYLKKIAANYAQPYINGNTVDKVAWVIVRKEYERFDGKGRSGKILAAHLNVYHLSELEDIEILLPESIRDAATNSLEISKDTPLIIEGRSKPTSVIMLGGNQLSA